MVTKTITSYYLSAKGMGGHWSQDGWTGYNERWKMMKDDKLPKGEDIYGYEQVLAHAAEMRIRWYDGRQPNLNTEFIIVIKTTVETFVPIL